MIEGNFIGTDPTGTLARPNSGGIRVFSSDNRIGGLTPAARNVISGNTGPGSRCRTPPRPATSCRATTSASTPPAPRRSRTAMHGRHPDSTAPAATRSAARSWRRQRRLGEHRQHAITVAGASANDNVIQGNFIGTDPTGTVRMANGRSASTSSAPADDRRRPRRWRGTSSPATAPACRSGPAHRAPWSRTTTSA